MTPAPLRPGTRRRQEADPAVRRLLDTAGRPVVKVLPGGVYVTSEQELVATSLGSCVSACIRDPGPRLGGMNHFLLPEQHAGSGEGQSWKGSPADSASRYGSFAMERLINELLKRGARRESLEAKLVGAGRVLGGLSDVGARNAGFVLDYLRREGIRIVAADLGGSHARRVLYDPVSGRLLVKKLRGDVHGRVLNRERAYLRRAAAAAPAGGSVELF